MGSTDQENLGILYPLDWLKLPFRKTTTHEMNYRITLHLKKALYSEKKNLGMATALLRKTQIFCKI